MKKPELMILCGLPYSGKSTYAVRMKDCGWTVLCPDEIRLALHGHEFAPEAEDFVWAVCKTVARSLLKTNHRVCIDATNTTMKSRAAWIRMAQDFGALCEVFLFETDAQECKRRASENGADHMLSVIDRMAKNWEEPKEAGIHAVYNGLKGRR